MSIGQTLKRILADAWSCRSAAAQVRRDRERVYDALLWIVTRQRSMHQIKGPADKAPVYNSSIK